jgi:hypothetical protein
MNAARRIAMPVALLASALSPALAQADTPTPGDIPDNQAFVRLTSPAYQVSTPEGWARTTSPGRVSLSDKFNAITIELSRRATPPTPATVRTSELPHLRAAVRGFSSPRVTVVARPAGRAVLVRYQARSRRDAVTGKTVVNDVERYEFWKAGRLAAVTLEAPHGSDNVDPWRTVTTSFRWR